jgi:hypothetical protein
VNVVRDEEVQELFPLDSLEFAGLKISRIIV